MLGAGTGQDLAKGTLRFAQQWQSNEIGVVLLATARYNALRLWFMHAPSRPDVGPKYAERTQHNVCQSGAKMDIAAELDPDLDLHSQTTCCRHLIKPLPAAQGFPSFHGVALLQAMEGRAQLWCVLTLH